MSALTPQHGLETHGQDWCKHPVEEARAEIAVASAVHTGTEWRFVSRLRGLAPAWYSTFATARAAFSSAFAVAL